MKKEKQQLIIPFIGLKDGIHQFEFKINSTFFEQFDYSIIEKADFLVEVEFEKKPTLFNLIFKLRGTIVTSCDRCADDLEIEVEGDQSLIVKHGEKNHNEHDELRIIAPNEYELDLTNEIYEYIHLLMPTKVKHSSKKECNQEVIEKLKKLTGKQEKEVVDPRWNALLNLKDKSE